MIHYILLISITILSFFPFCVAQDATIPKEHTMVVFIHGTLVTPNRLKTVLGTEVKKKSAAESKALQEQTTPPQQHGLKKIEAFSPVTDLAEIPEKLAFVAQAFELLSKMTQQFKQESYSFYAFKWDGKLSEASRRHWATVLYDDLIAQADLLAKEHGVPVKIYTVAHSFGGKVAANLAAAEHERKKNLRIAKLINLGTPVQHELAGLLDSPIFEHTYHIYSPSDYVQIAGAIHSKGIYTRRQIHATKDKPLPTNLTQIEIKVDNTAPHHQELWLLGMSPVFYRDWLSIYPFPITAYVPIILDAIQHHSEQEKQVTVTLSRAENQYTLDLINNRKKEPFTYSFSEPWKSFLDEQTALLIPFNQAIKSTMRKYMLISGAALFGAGLRSYLQKRADKPAH